jgi:hypothetical protein
MLSLSSISVSTVRFSASDISDILVVFLIFLKMVSRAVIRLVRLIRSLVRSKSIFESDPVVLGSSIEGIMLMFSIRFLPTAS